MHQGHDSGCNGRGVPEKDREKALLQYMLAHNESHGEELQKLAGCLEEKAAAMVFEALACYKAGNEKLAQALASLQEG